MFQDESGLSELKVDFKSQVFLVTDNKKISDIYKEAIQFFEIEKDNDHAPLDDNEDKNDYKENEDKEIKESKDKKDIKERDKDKKKTVGFNISDDKDGKDGKDEGNNKQNEETKKRHKDNCASKDYILTDHKHNDLQLLFKVPVITFFTNEDYPYMVFYLRKKNTKQKNL